MVSEPIYVYTLTADGKPRERKGHITKRCGKYILVSIDNSYQRLCLSSRQTDIHNNAMWSNQPQKNVYIERMIELLMDRQKDYRAKIDSTQKRINKLKQGWENN